MKNKSVSDFVAATMDAVLNSREHKALFSGHYKYAQDMNDAKKGKKEVCPECNKVMDKNMMDSCSCGDKSYAMDDEVFADDMGMSMYSDDMGMSMDSDDVEDYSMDMDGMHSTAAFDVAIDGLLTASAALDAVGMSNSSTVSLKLASLIVEAKKVKKEEEKSVKSTKSTKSKKPAPAKNKLKSKDFKKMLEEDDDGKLTAANFKKMRNASSKHIFSKFAAAPGITDSYGNLLKPNQYRSLPRTINCKSDIVNRLSGELRKFITDATINIMADFEIVLNVETNILSGEQLETIKKFLKDSINQNPIKYYSSAADYVLITPNQLLVQKGLLISSD